MRKHILVAAIAALLAFVLFTSVILGQSSRPCQRGARARICRTPIVQPTPMPTAVPSLQLVFDDCAGGVVNEPARNSAPMYFTITHSALRIDTQVLLTIHAQPASTATLYVDYEPHSDLMWYLSGSPLLVDFSIYADSQNEPDETVLLIATWTERDAFWRTLTQGTDTAQCMIRDS